MIRSQTHRPNTDRARASDAGVTSAGYWQTYYFGYFMTKGVPGD